jgi:hypothetical protein
MIKFEPYNKIMKPKWLIEHFDDKNGTRDLIAEVRRQGYEVSTIEYEPLQKGSIDAIGPEECVITQTSIDVARQIMKEKKWVPGPWLTAKNYECTSYYPHLGKFLLNDPYVMMPRKEIPRHLSLLHKWVGKDLKLFIRPNSGLKPFTAQVFNCSCDVKLANEEGIWKTPLFDKDWHWVEEFTEPDTLIVIAGPKKIQAEYRFVIAGTDVVTGCTYMPEIAVGYTQAARDLAAEVAKAYQPDPMFIVDICFDGEKYWLMEIGAFSVAGLYACKMEDIVPAAVKMAKKEWEDIHG